MDFAVPDSQIFPQELVDYVIDFCHDDIAALQAFARVSQPCLPSARRHIFDTITIKPGQDGPSSLDGLASLMKLDSTVCLSVRHLYFDGASQDSSQPGILGEVALSIILDAIHLFTNLRILSIENVVLIDDVLYSIPDITERRAIHSLDFVGCDVRTETHGWRPIFHILSHFSFINALTLYEVAPVSLGIGWGHCPSPSTCKTRVRNMAIARILPRARFLVDGLLALLDMRDTRRIHVGYSLLLTPFYRPLLEAAGNLFTLTVHNDCTCTIGLPHHKPLTSSTHPTAIFDPVIAPEDEPLVAPAIAPSIKLQGCTNLQFLTVVFHSSDYDKTDLLVSLPLSSTIPFLTVQFYVESPESGITGERNIELLFGRAHWEEIGVELRRRFT